MRRNVSDAKGPMISNALQVADVNDFLTPAAACVLPLGGGATASVETAPPGSVLAPIIPSQSEASGVFGTRPKAKVSLSDCLTCSGCVTSSETVLLASTNLDKVRDLLVTPSKRSEREDLYVVVALSQQAVSSIAVHIGVSLDDAAGKLATFFTTHLHVDSVLDLSFTRRLALHEAALEFIDRHRAGQKVVITSACPGWVTYAEKTQGQDILNYISRVRSPQAIAGAIVPHLVRSSCAETKHSPTHGPPKRRKSWLMTVMPCHDKKLESSRPAFVTNGNADVECVLTASEVMDLASELGVDIASLPCSPLDPRSISGPNGFGTATGSGSGGYADYVLRIAAAELLGVNLDSNPLEMQKMSRSGDIRSISVSSLDGSRRLSFATAYGFRSLQSVLRKLKRGECDYDYIELMACPGGCNNGGGQISAPSADKAVMKKHLDAVEAAYQSANNVGRLVDSADVESVYSRVGLSMGCEMSRKLLYTDYERREQSTVAALSSW